MRFLLNIIFALTIALLPIFSMGQTIDSGYEVAKWQGFSEAAITYTFDDNCANQYKVAIPMLNEFDFGGTFYPVVNWGPQWAKFKSAAVEGHEIGSHTISHPTLNTLDLTKQEEELKNSKDRIDTEIGENACETIAYPYCVPSNVALTKKYFIAARHCQGQINKSTPADFMNISSIICGESGSLKTIDNFKSNYESTAKITGWSVYLIHGIDGDGGYSSLNSDVLRGSLEFLDQNRERFWVVTFVDAVRYIRERNSVSVKESDVNNESLTVEVSDTLDNSVYNIPVTIRRQLPDGWGSALVLHGADTLYSEIVKISDLKFVKFDVVPDVAKLKIVKAENTSYSMHDGNHKIQITPNPFQHELKISAPGNFEYQLFSLGGKVVDSGMGNDVHVLGSFLVPGIYFLNVQNNEGLLRRKIIKM